MGRGYIVRMGSSGCVGYGEQHAGEFLSQTYATVGVTSWLLAASLVGGVVYVVVGYPTSRGIEAHLARLQ